jgi:hypothetical protein
MSHKKRELPPEITDDKSDDLDPEEALGRLIMAMTTDQSIEMMSYLKNEESCQKIWLMLCMGRRKGFEWLVFMAKTKLMLLCSTDKGVRARLAVELAKALGGGGMEEKQGLTDRIKSSFKRNFVES